MASPRGARAESRSGSRNDKGLPNETGNPDVGYDETQRTGLMITDEAELNKRFTKLCKKLKDYTEEWEVRVALLHELRDMLVGGSHEHEAFVPLLHQLKDCLAVQATDLRSAVVKEACETLSHLSRVLKKQFDPFADYFIPVLFKPLIVTIQIISDSADQCIRSLIESSRIKSALKKILDGAKNPRGHKILRKSCCDYLLIYLQRTSTKRLEKNADIIAADLVKILDDPDAAVKATARQCYHCYSQHFPQKAKTKVVAKLDQSQRKFLESGGKVGAPVRRGSLTSVSSDSSASSAKSRTKAPGSPAGGKPRSMTYSSPLAKKKDSQSGYSSSTSDNRAGRSGSGSRTPTGRGSRTMSAQTDSKAKRDYHTDAPPASDSAISVASADELQEEVHSIVSLLSTIESDPDVRAGALRRLRGLLNGGAAEYDVFSNLVEDLKDPLATQASDKKGTIVKETCDTLVLLAQKMGDRFRPFADFFIPILYKLNKEWFDKTMK